MAPAKVPEDDDDPVTAEYDVYLTPSQAEEIFLLQYPNRVRTRPYNDRTGSRPQDVRIKPTTGFIELDVNLNTGYNFNKYKSLQWGDALNTARDIQNSSGTYGPAAGFSGAKPRTAGRMAVKDQADRQLQIQHDLAGFKNAESDGKVMRVQTLGGQVIRHDGPDEIGKPIYFVGAFRNDQLHLTKVTGTAQMRPQFHHLDAEEQRARIAASRASAAELGEPRPAGEARSILAREKKLDDSDKVRLEDVLRKQLSAAEAEEWTKMDYIDEDMQAAYDLFNDRMFVKDVEAAPRLKSDMDSWDYLDAISKPRRGSVGRRRRKKGKEVEGVDLEDGEDEALQEGG
ncbi:hypothetical protein LTR78_002271 [Recurvomyces mirabilis]|uniref:Uncharacterized protein n=1 Tax=Recurvomyces mirabilis TaxID=574656 RepID=A0AAE0WU22_9PEZI|nr:hypothetical protein LTR78_002271 [Recurvomyces mirabilis]KAK5160725.1 hypothetical protein LTS14_001738 [Recurvomyces mirabilis]